MVKDPFFPHNGDNNVSEG